MQIEKPHSKKTTPQASDHSSKLPSNCQCTPLQNKVFHGRVLKALLFPSHANTRIRAKRSSDLQTWMQLSALGSKNLHLLSTS